MDSKKMIQRNLFTKQTQMQGKGMITRRERRWGGTNEEFGINKYTLYVYKTDNNKDILYNTWNYIYLTTICNGEESESVCALIHI